MEQQPSAPAAGELDNDQCVDVMTIAKAQFQLKVAGATDLLAEIAALPLDSTIAKDVGLLVTTKMPLTANQRLKETERYHTFIRSGRSRSQDIFGLSPLSYVHFVPCLFSVWLDKLRPAPTRHDEPAVAMDQEALKYVGGFFLRKLRSMKSIDTSELIASWTTDAGVDESWTGLQDRGGLVHINEVFLSFLYELENSSYRFICELALENTNISHQLFDLLAAEQSIRDQWGILTAQHEIPPQFTDAIFVCLVSAFTQLRCQAHVAWLQRNSSSAVAKPSHSLRQSLQ